MKKNNLYKFIKILILTIFVLIALVVIVVASTNLYIVKSTEDQIITPEQAKDKDADCVIILGAMVYSDGTPSKILRERLDKGIELYNLGVADRLLMSGDNGQREYNEVIPMRKYAIENGIPKEDIFLDYAGFSTYESMYRLRDIFLVKKAIVVTQTYHLHRALYFGNNLDIEVFGVAAEDVAVGQNRRDMREILARVKAFISVKTDAEPTYLGDPVPLDTPQKITE